MINEYNPDQSQHITHRARTEEELVQAEEDFGKHGRSWRWGRQGIHEPKVLQRPNVGAAIPRVGE